MSACAEIGMLLGIRPAGVLDDDEALAVDAHLEGCSGCRTRASEADGAWALLQDEAPIADSPATPLWAAIAKRLDEPAPPEAEPPRAAPVSIALACCYCKDAIARGEATYCASCLAPHHDDCFRAHGRCSAHGCDEVRTVRPGGAPAAPKRAPRVRPKFLLGVAIAAVVGAGGVAAWGQRQKKAELAEAQAERAELLAERELLQREAEAVRRKADLDRQRLKLAEDELSARPAPRAGESDRPPGTNATRGLDLSDLKRQADLASKTFFLMADARDLVAKGEHIPAVLKLEELLALEPDSVEGLRLRGVVALRLKDSTCAIVSFKRYLALTEDRTRLGVDPERAAIKQEVERLMEGR